MIVLAANGATVFAIAAKFKTFVETIERKAREARIPLSAIRGKTADQVCSLPERSLGT